MSQILNNFPTEEHKRYCEWDNKLIPKRDTLNWSAYSKRRFCSQQCSSDWRRAQPCGRCGGQDWYEGPDGKRACRTCKGRSASERRKITGTRAPADRRKRSTFVEAPVKVHIPDAPLPELKTPEQLWRPASWIEQDKRKKEQGAA